VKVSVITPTTGSSFLQECIESVRNQTYKNIEHIVVVDGPHDVDVDIYDEHVIYLPYATGTNRYNGHRIYGAMTFIADGDYHIWLDEDNTLEPNHIESLVKIVQENNLDWAYSLRKIIDKNSNVLCLDDCESLGKYTSVLNDNFVDVNCFFVKKEIAIQITPVWYRKAREPNVMEIDRAITAILMNDKNKLRFDSNNDYTVRYRVGNTGISVQAEFFLQGNAKMLEAYGGNLPWKNK
jgi:glycosyltransferase involved in cell wall biosynthesis